jgi:ATP-dependent protease ClpP protease subunit
MAESRINNRWSSSRKKTEFEQLISSVHGHNINYNTREIYLHGFFGDEEPGVDYRMAAIFIKNLGLLDLQSSDNVLVHMQTVGGCWNNGMAIFNAMQFSKSPVSLLAYAHSRSMSSIIPQAATKRVIMPDADFMIHNGTYSDEGEFTAVMSGAEHAKRSEIRMLQIYANRCIHGEYFKKKYKSITLAKVMGFLKKKLEQKVDWWITAEEAVYYGFYDGVMGSKGFETIEKIRLVRRKIKPF